MIPQDPELLIGIVHADLPPWNSIARLGQGATWLSSADPPWVRVVYAHGERNSKLTRTLDGWHEGFRRKPPFGLAGVGFLKVVDYCLTYPLRTQVPKWRLDSPGALPRPSVCVNVPDTFLTAPKKELALLEYFISNTKASWLYMTTSSSYLRPDYLITLLGALGRSGVYAGSRIVQGRRVFASGANRAVSRDVASAILENRARWDRTLLEDVGLGVLASRLGYDVMPLPTLNVDTVHRVKELELTELTQTHHFRLKSGDLKHRRDVSVMAALHERLLAEGLV